MKWIDDFASTLRVDLGFEQEDGIDVCLAESE